MIEAVLRAEDDRTRLVIEERGLPIDELFAYGAGWQAHVEDLAAHLAGGRAGRLADALGRAVPAYRDLAGGLGMTGGPDTRAAATGERTRCATPGGAAAQRPGHRRRPGHGDLRRSVVPSGWTPLGLIEHLAAPSASGSVRSSAGTPDPADGRPGPFAATSPAAQVLAFYRDQTARSDGILAGTALDARPAGPVPAHLAEEVHTVRDVVLHMVEESARHAGHLDIARGAARRRHRAPARADLSAGRTRPPRWSPAFMPWASIQTPGVGPGAVGVGDAVGVGELAGADDRARPTGRRRGRGQRGDAPGDVGRRLGDREPGLVRAGVAPGRLGDAEVLQHLLRAQPARGHADGGDGVLGQLGR